MRAVASLWETPAFEILEVVGQVVVTDNELCGLLDWITMGSSFDLVDIGQT